ncbi:MAG: response regulator [Actinomyces sp.]|jgi:two-component system chemotaxis response regulator CheY|nr:response regulator [Actinomyces sp.]MCI1661536.1 response regulator [Actinomyces sp.]MCI1690643.1 response regulator [Actinomyces sp.]MCI1866156.1 response regulator [Actinomyces sp.]
MMLTILVLEDEDDVRHEIERDLDPFASAVRIEAASDADDAWAAIEDVLADGDRLALVLADHRLPGRTGVDFLVEVARDPRTRGARTVLVTGQAGQADTVRALNDAGLDHYIAKPWDPRELAAVVRDQLTEYVLDQEADPLPVLPVLDEVRIMEALRHRS